MNLFTAAVKIEKNEAPKGFTKKNRSRDWRKDIGCRPRRAIPEGASTVKKKEPEKKQKKKKLPSARKWTTVVAVSHRERLLEGHWAAPYQFLDFFYPRV